MPSAPVTGTAKPVFHTATHAVPGAAGGTAAPGVVTAAGMTSSRMGHLLDALACGYDVLGCGRATSRDKVFRQLVLARIIEPLSKLDSLQVLEEAGVAPASYATLKRRLRPTRRIRGGASSRPRARRTRTWAQLLAPALSLATAGAPGPDPWWSGAGIPWWSGVKEVMSPSREQIIAHLANRSLNHSTVATGC